MLTVSARDFQLHQKDYLDKLPVMLTVYGKPVAYVLKELPATVFEESLPQEKKELTGTMPVKYKYVVSGLHPTGETIPASSSIPTNTIKVNMPEALWEDYNLMPVYKVGVPDQYCVTWHTKGERKTVYPIKKFRSDGSLEVEGKYCKECIKEFLTKDGHLE